MNLGLSSSPSEPPPVQSQGNIDLVLLQRLDGKVIAFTDASQIGQTLTDETRTNSSETSTQNRKPQQS